jgi:archaellum component FlaC
MSNQYDLVYDKLIDQIDENANIQPREAEVFANKFFKALYNIAKDLRDARSELAIIEPTLKMVYCEAIKKNKEGKTVTEKKTMAEGDDLYIETIKIVTECKNNVEYLKDLYSTIENGFIFFRQMSKQ